MNKMIIKLIIACFLVLGTGLLVSRLAAASTGSESRLSAYRGWSDSVFLSNRSAEVIMVPQVARVLHFSLRGMSNILWEDPAAGGQLQNPDSETTGEYVNYGGAKLWVAPQSKWGTKWTVWPPFYGLDSGPCKSSIRKDGSVLLTGLDSRTAGVRIDRTASLAKNSVSFVYTMSNISDKPVEWGIWMVANVKPGGRTFIPYVDNAELWSNEKDKKVPDSFAWKRQDGLLVMDFPEGKDGSKLFSLSAGGWLAYIVEGQAFFITYTPDLKAVQPEGEAPTEIFRGKDFVELEHVGPLVKLSPGGTTSLTERWHLLKAPAISDPAALAAWVSKTAAKLPK